MNIQIYIQSRYSICSMLPFFIDLKGLSLIEFLPLFFLEKMLLNGFKIGFTIRLLLPTIEMHS